MELVRDAMRTWLRGVELERSEVEDVVLATWEACANAIEHALEPAEHIVVVRAALDDSLIRITIGDTGQWAPPTGREDRGLGLRLMEALVSSSPSRKAPTGTTVSSRRPWRPTRAGRLEQPDQQHDDHDQRKHSTTDVHRPSFRRRARHRCTRSRTA